MRRGDPVEKWEIASHSLRSARNDMRKIGICMPGKYTALENYLRDLPQSQREVTLGFDQIEKILNSKLPSSANEQSWWDHETEGNHRNTRAWTNAGWKVESVDFNRKQARLVRT